MYELIFEPNEQDKERFQICYQAVMATPATITRDLKGDVLSLVKKLKDISVPAKEYIGSVQLRDLADDGGRILLENGEYKFLLDKCIRSEIWRPNALEAQDQTEQWLHNLYQVNLKELKRAESTGATRSEEGSVRRPVEDGAPSY